MYNNNQKKAFETLRDIEVYLSRVTNGGKAGNRAWDRIVTACQVITMMHDGDLTESKTTTNDKEITA